MPTIAFVFRLLGLQGVIIAAAFVFYEGLPGVDYITPYLRVIPAVGPLVDDLALGRVGRSRAAGQLDERLIWQEKQRRADLKREQVRLDAEKTIERIERDYLSRHAAAAIRISELEKALDEEQTSGVAAGCSPAMSRKLRDALDRVGRD